MCYAFRDILLLIPTHILKIFVVHFLLKYLETVRDIGAGVCVGGGGCDCTTCHPAGAVEQHCDGSNDKDKYAVEL